MTIFRFDEKVCQHCEVIWVEVSVCIGGGDEDVFWIEAKIVDNLLLHTTGSVIFVGALAWNLAWNDLVDGVEKLQHLPRVF